MYAVHNSWLLGDLLSSDILMSAFDAADLEVDFNVCRDRRSIRVMAIIDHNLCPLLGSVLVQICTFANFKTSPGTKEY
jgi:hypothetical protein